MPSGCPVVDFDHHSDSYKADWKRILHTLRTEAPVAWTEHYGGFWVVTLYEDVARVFRDVDTFTTAHHKPNDGKSFTGTVMPAWPDVLIPMEIDGPAHTAYRRFMNPWFSPAAVAAMRPRLESFVTWCLDQRIETGTIDLVNDLANPIPAMVTLDMLGLDASDWEFFAPPFHGLVAYVAGSEGFAEAVAGYEAIRDRVLDEVRSRRERPRDDKISELLTYREDGELLAEEVLLQVINLILAGGVDTTTTLLASAFHGLDENRDARARLRADPSLLASACEEFLRIASPGQVHVRTATKDVEVHGQLIRQGERVLISMASANHDPEGFERPDELVVDRFPNHHVAFGMGAHRCIGAAFAREEFVAVIEQLLRRMPDYEVTAGAERYPNFGMMQGWVTMPARFTPGPKIGATL
jgi:cytochrome P450